MDPLHLQRANKLYRKYKPVRITQKEHLLIWNSEITQNLNIYLYNIQTETAIFLATKHEKKLWHAVIYIFKKSLRHFELLAVNEYYKNESIHLNSWHHSHEKQIVWKRRSYLLIFTLELEILGVTVKKIHQSSKKWWLL